MLLLQCVHFHLFIIISSFFPPIFLNLRWHKCCVLFAFMCSHFASVCVVFCYLFRWNNKANHLNFIKKCMLHIFSALFFPRNGTDFVPKLNDTLLTFPKCDCWFNIECVVKTRVTCARLEIWCLEMAKVFRLPRADVSSCVCVCVVFQLMRPANIFFRYLYYFIRT